jgi:hypothetical protein
MLSTTALITYSERVCFLCRPPADAVERILRPVPLLGALTSKPVTGVVWTIYSFFCKRMNAKVAYGVTGISSSFDLFTVSLRF